MKIKPEFTEAQARVVRIALKNFLAAEWGGRSKRQVGLYALAELERACFEAGWWPPQAVRVELKEGDSESKT